MGEIEGTKDDGASLDAEQDNLDDSRLSLAEAETRKEPSAEIEVTATSANEENEVSKQEQSDTNSIDDPKERPAAQEEKQNAESTEDSKGENENSGSEISAERQPENTVETEEVVDE